jgi:POT family proton-dependent oligopeptide transporter
MAAPFTMPTPVDSKDDYAVRHGYSTQPVESDGMPSGIPYIIASEFAERFCFYGMKAILIVFMTQYLMSFGGKPDPMSQEDAKYWFHLFVAGVYAFPFLGAIVADGILGKYRTILYLSLVYCLGCVALALDSSRLGLFAGLTLIVIGAGGIKPCVSATVGDQFGTANQHLLPRVFSWFYFSINSGCFIAMVVTPLLLEAGDKKWGPHFAFGLPGALMLVATLIFWLGRKKYVHAAPAGKAFIRETFTPANLPMLGRLLVLYLFVAMFWSLYDQTSSSWVLQAEHMNLNLFGGTPPDSASTPASNPLANLLAGHLKASQVQSASPLLILILIPVFSYVVYPIVGKFVQCTPLRKIAAGLFMAVIGFSISALIEVHIAKTPTVWWQILAYAFMTAAEVLISITCLEYSYTQAPARLKSLVMSIYLGSIATGNLFTALVNKFIQNPDHTSKLPGASYYFFFTAMMLVTGVLFLGFMRFLSRSRPAESPASKPA